MGEQAVPEQAAGAEQIGLSAREAKAAVQPRDAGNWAAKVERLAGSSATACAARTWRAAA